MSTGELTTAQVAEYLGVKVETVYAYVSRGVLTPRRREPGTGSLFAVEDVQALVRGGRAGRRGQRLAASDDVRTAITEVTPANLSYRGHDIAELVSGRSFEDVRALLVGVPSTEPGAVAQVSDPATLDTLRAVMAALPRDSAPLDRFKHAVVLAGAADLGRHDRSPAAMARAGEYATLLMALTLPGVAEEWDAAATPPSLATILGNYLPTCPARLIDAVLVLLADHDLAVSTTAVRVAVSSGANAYSALLAGLAAADSPLHLTASLRAGDWLAGAMRDPRAALDAALLGGPPPGFGHLVYTESDPRAQLLLDRLAPHAVEGELAALRLIEEELLERCGWVLNVDLALAMLVRCFDLPRDAGVVLFALARTAGWTAHAVEELTEAGMRFRLKGIYSGPRTASTRASGTRADGG